MYDSGEPKKTQPTSEFSHQTLTSASSCSKDVLTNIITNSLHTGICLYQTTLSDVSITELQSNQVALKNLHVNDNDAFNSLMTHLIAPVTPDAMGQIPHLTSQDDNRVLNSS